MTVVTITHEVGSPGEEIAAKTAERLGLELVHREQLERNVAERMNMNVDSVHRLLVGGASLLERWTMSDGHRVRCYMMEQLLRLAATGNAVILSCEAATMLRPINHVISVNVCASTHEHGGWHKLRHSDAARRGVRQWQFAGSWQVAMHYDLVLNAQRIPVAECVEQVHRLANCPYFQPTSASRGVLASLMREVDSNLTADNSGDSDRHGLQVDLGDQTVGLVGVQSSEQAIAKIEEHWRGRAVRAVATEHWSYPPNGTI